MSTPDQGDDTIIGHYNDILMQRRRELRTLLGRLSEQYRLIVVSNRGPVEFARDAHGSLQAGRGSGGLASALRALNQYAEPAWVMAAVQGGGHQGDGRQDSLTYHEDGQRFHLRFVTLSADEYHQYYNIIANTVLWSIHHTLSDQPQEVVLTAEICSAWRMYEHVNQLFADAVVREASGKRSIILLQDYHLYLVAGQLRTRLGDQALISIFVHIPWPGPAHWSALPAAMREAVLRSCCALDIIGFHLPRYALHFLYTCHAYLPDAEVDFEARIVRLNEKTTYVRAYPISVDVIELQRRINTSARVQDQLGMLASRLSHQTIVRIDRIDPVKNIVRGFKAFELLLEQHPEHCEHVTFLAFLVPSRLALASYQSYFEEICDIVGRINVRYGTCNWQPIELFIGENYERALAAMQIYDVLIINSLSDGMNLIAKEGPSINQVNGVLILSESVGAVEQLGDAAIVISSTDVVNTAEGLQQALTMPIDERLERSRRLKRRIAEEDISIWIQQQFTDIMALAAGESIL
jgi:trehalose 6-phosphate synthase